MFAYDAIPGVDMPMHSIGRTEALRLIEQGSHYYIHDRAIQACPPPELRIAGASFADAWKIRPSAGMPVWQMVTR